MDISLLQVTGSSLELHYRSKRKNLGAMVEGMVQVRRLRPANKPAHQALLSHDQALRQ